MIWDYKLIRVVGLKLWLDINIHEIKNIIFRNTLCKFGWHKIYSSGEEYHMNSRDIYLHTYYVGCSCCGHKFFPTIY